MSDSTHGGKISLTDLIALKQEALLHSIAQINISSNLFRNYQWRLRALIFTISGTFISLCISSTEFRVIQIGAVTKIFISTFIVLGTYFYDAHLNDLIKSLKDAHDAERKSLNDLFIKSYDELLLEKSHRPIRPAPKDFHDWFCNRFWLKIKNSNNLDFYFIYIAFSAAIVLGWFAR